MALSVGGLGSNLPVDDLITRLMAIERQPLQKLQKQELTLNAKIASLGQVKGALSSFQTTVKSLTDPAKFSSINITSSDATVASASTTSNKVSPSSYGLEVTQLAQAQRLVTKTGFASTSTAIGGGSLTFSFGEQNGSAFVDNPNKSSRTVSIPPNATLATIRDSINKANIGVSANIVNDGINGNRLVYSVADTGVQNGLKITAAGDNGALSSLTYDPAAGASANMTQLQAATNAKLTLDGIAIEKASNTISDAIEGVSFSLSKVGSSRVTITQSSGDAKKNIESFVKAYNDLNKTLDDVSAIGKDAPKPGEQRPTSPLSNEFVIRSIKTSLRTSFNTVATGLTGAVKLPSDVGISFDRSGKLTLDSTKLEKALKDDPQAVASLFGATAQPTDKQISFLGSTNQTTVGSYDVKISAMNYGVVQGAAVNFSTPVSVGAFDLSIDGVSKSFSGLPSASYSSATSAAVDLQSTINRSYMGVTGTSTFPQTVGANNFAITVDGVSKSGLSIPEATYDNADDLKTALQSSLDTAFGSGKAVVETNGSEIRILSAGSTNSSTVTMGAGLEFAGFTSAQTDATRPSVTVSVDSATGALQIASNKKGASSTVTVSSGLASLGLSDGMTNTGKASVEGTIGGFAVTSVGSRLTGNAGTPIDGLSIDITGGATGDRGSVNFTRGFAWALDKALTDLQGTNGPIASRQQGINTSLKLISKQQTAVSQRIDDTEARLRKQFNAMDEAVSKLTALGNYVTQQMQAFQNAKG